MVEILLSVFCIMLIIYLGRVGAALGLFWEMTSTLLLLFAMLVAMRYWYLGTGLISSVVPVPEFPRSPYSAFVAYWVLFLIGSIPLLPVMRAVKGDSRPKYPNILDPILGFMFGATSATILVCSVMTSLSVILPKVWDSYEPSVLFRANVGSRQVRLDTASIEIYRFLEQDCFGITNASHTRLPTLDKTNADDFDKYWR